MSSTLPEYERFKEVHRLLRNYPVRLPLVADFLQEHRQELMEHYVEELAVYLEMISRKREKELQKDMDECDEYYHLRLPKFTYPIKRPENRDAGWPEKLGKSPRYPNMERPYMVKDPKQREEYIRMLPKALAWQELHEIKKLRAAYVEIEPKIFNTFAFFNESGKKT